jgi:hypothetical protein
MPQATRLGAVDVFHLRSHEEMVSQGLAGNACAMVIDVEGHVDRARLEDRVREAVLVVPELGERLGYRLAIDPVWRAGAIPNVNVLSRTGSLEEHAAAIIDEPIDGSRPWELIILRGDRDDAVVLRWFQPFTDARGATRLGAWLGSDERLEPVTGVRMAADRLLEGVAARERVELSRRYFRHVMKLARTPILSLHAASKERPGRVRCVRVRFDREATSAFFQSLPARAKLADTSILLFAATRMLDRALARRGFSPPQHLCPVPLSFDGSRDTSRMLGNHLTMMMMALDRDELCDEGRAVSSLARQRRAIVKDKLDLCMVAALDVARYMPARAYSWASRRPFGGERSSLIVSNPGELTIDRFLGQTVRDAFLVPTVLAPPGFQVVADRHGGRLSVSVIFREGVIGEAEVRELLPGLERDLIGC